MKTLATMVLLSVAVAGQADDGERKALLLHRDPFVRREAPPMALAGTAIAEPAPWRGQLRMTLRAGRQSMVNVNGKSVPLGGKFDGYTLVAVEERSARFTRDGRTITVGLDDDPQPNSEAAAAP